MKCTKCNSELLDSDTFCPVCGAKVVRAGRCPHCNAVLRPGARFCQSCGKSVNETVFTADQDEEDEEEEDDVPVKEQETKDIPFDEVEKNIIAEAAHSVRSRDRKVKEEAKENRIFREDKEEPPKGRNQRRPRGPEERRSRNPEEEHRREAVRIREMHEREDYEYDDDEDDGVEKGLMIAMVIVGALIISAILMILFVKVRDGRASDKAETAAATVEKAEGSGRLEAVPESPGEGPAKENEQESFGTVYITSDVRVRSTPTTDEDNILGAVSAGDTFEFLGYSDNRNWVRIRCTLDGRVQEGYVSSSYVQVQENQAAGGN